jgi:toxin ParE1/3/4
VTRVKFRPAAEADLNGLFDHLSLEASPRVAGDYVRRVHAACVGLETFPLRGAPRDDLGPGVRLLGFERRVAIAYAVEDDEVVILGVFYGGRDFEAILRGGS